MTGFSIRMQITCAGCTHSIPVNALAERFFCVHCGEEIRITVDQWGDIIHDPLMQLCFLSSGKEIEDSLTLAAGKISFTIAEEAPVFPESGRPIPFDPDNTQKGEVKNPESYEHRLLRPPPDQYSVRLPGLVRLAGESAAQLPVDKTDRALLGEPVPGEQHAFLCSGCGAALKAVADTRLVNCTSCGRSTLAPDALWQKLHPEKESRKWYGWLDPTRENWSSLPWSSLRFVFADNNGNCYACGHSAVLKDKEAFASFDPDGRLRWLSTDRRLKDTWFGASITGVSIGPGDNFLYWIESTNPELKPPFHFFSKETGKKQRDPDTPLFGNAGPDGMKNVEWVIHDRDGSILISRYNYGINEWEIARYTEDGTQIPCWEEQKKRSLFKKKNMGLMPGEIGLGSLDLGWQGADGSYYFAEKDHTRLVRYTRDGTRHYHISREEQLLGLSGDENGNAYVMVKDTASEMQLPAENGILLNIRNFSLLRISPAGEVTVLADSVLRGGHITLEQYPVVMPDGSIALFGAEGRLLRYSSDGKLLEGNRHSLTLGRRWRDALNTDEPEITGLIGIELEIQAVCPGCKDRVPVNAMMESLLCPACGTELKITASEWYNMLKDPCKNLLFKPPYEPEDAVHNLAAQEMSITMRREEPVFPASGYAIPCSNSAAETGSVSDPNTGAVVSFRRPPGFFTPGFPNWPFWPVNLSPKHNKFRSGNRKLSRRHAHNAARNSRPQEKPVSLPAPSAVPSPFFPTQSGRNCTPCCRRFAGTLSWIRTERTSTASAGTSSSSR